MRKTFLFDDPFFNIVDRVFDNPLRNLDSVKTTILKNDDGYELLMGLPGLTKDDLKISIKEKKLTISYEKTLNENKSHFVESFNKTYTIPDDVIEEKINGEVVNGVLKLKIPIGMKKTNERLISLN